MQDYNYHTHTYRCRHAVGTEKDYIENAINNGFKYLGFSEHCAYSDWKCSTGRLQGDEMYEYYNSINYMKEVYKNDLTIFTGLECEYFPDLKNYFLELKEKFDYIVVGQHSLDRKGRNVDNICTDEDLKLYCKFICESIENNVADYIAHIDYFMLGRNNYNQLCRDIVKEISMCAKEYSVPVELNLKGASYGIKEYEGYKSFIYPHIKTFEVLADVNPILVCGYDAHNPNSFSNREIETTIRNIAKDFGLVKPLEKLIIKKR